jgi:hypothetical protein
MLDNGYAAKAVPYHPHSPFHSAVQNKESAVPGTQGRCPGGSGFLSWGMISVYPIFSILLLFYTQNEIKPGNKKRSKYVLLVILTMITGYFPHAEGSRLRIHKPHNAIY